ncbi:TetR/AcrR family transcriptional regulator [Roseiarcaceae bacterium H3SJ34-1]|uniref:TetR/AcrR family transcriptional regulator n=1 Tax=Terripilifer ovatus TaxID=3032367 RepID=UPI003AB9621B|nr:TetR/AcrR family transcriptional regulator [Roseiarcaceae bacterium H3SJ34-1]
MKVSREQARENRRTVVSVAGRLFRERGFDGIGLSDLMKAAGLTHGGFYKQFKSKDDLIVEASAQALEESAGRWSRIIRGASLNPLAGLIRFYLSKAHRDRPGEGCVFAALAPDVARHDALLKKAFEAGMEKHLLLFDGLLSDAPDEATRNQSITMVSAMVGALVLSRAVENKALSQRILKTVADDLIARANAATSNTAYLQ